MASCEFPSLAEAKAIRSKKSTSKPSCKPSRMPSGKSSSKSLSYSNTLKGPKASPIVKPCTHIHQPKSWCSQSDRRKKEAEEAKKSAFQAKKAALEAKFSNYERLYLMTLAQTQMFQEDESFVISPHDRKETKKFINEMWKMLMESQECSLDTRDFIKYYLMLR